MALSAVDAAIKDCARVAANKTASQGTVWVVDAEIRGAYEGESIVDKGVRKAHGRGIAKGRDCYEGEFQYGEIQGQGTYAWADGNKYVGEWKDGIANGVGTLIWSNGTTYNGEIVNHNRKGFGILSLSKNDKHLNHFLRGKGAGKWEGDKYVVIGMFHPDPLSEGYLVSHPYSLLGTCGGEQKCRDAMASLEGRNRASMAVLGGIAKGIEYLGKVAAEGMASGGGSYTDSSSSGSSSSSRGGASSSGSGTPKGVKSIGNAGNTKVNGQNYQIYSVQCHSSRWANAHMRDGKWYYQVGEMGSRYNNKSVDAMAEDYCR